MVERHQHYENTFEFCEYDIDFIRKKLNISYDKNTSSALEVAVTDFAQRFVVTILPLLAYLFIYLFLVGLEILDTKYFLFFLYFFVALIPVLFIFDKKTKKLSKFWVQKIAPIMLGGKKQYIILNGKQKKKIFKILHCGNFVTEYDARKDYSKYLKRISMNEIEYDYGNEFEDSNKTWLLTIEFTKVPKQGFIEIMNRSGRRLKLLQG